MEGDFAVDPLSIDADFTRVLLQQGRVLLPADWNAMVALFTRQVRSLAVDLIGPHGGPEANPGFRISRSASNEVLIGPGVYWVGGIRVALSSEVKYVEQPFFRAPVPTAEGMFYLDVWEQHVSAAEDPTLREVALGGPDTTSRARVAWQVRFLEGTVTPAPTLENAWQILNDRLKREPRLRAEAKKDNQDTACIIAPDASYRGFENQLYRVEIHQGSKAGVPPTYKWSRDNGSITFPVESLNGTRAIVDFLGRDQRTGLAPGDWVEIVDDQSLFSDDPRPLVRVEKVDRSARTVDFKQPPGGVPPSAGRRILRRWERDAAPIPSNQNVFELENGVMVAFSGTGFRRGDYWLIPARTALRDVIWTTPPPGWSKPHGPRHRYAPLAYVTAAGLQELRYEFSLNRKAVPPPPAGGGGAVLPVNLTDLQSHPDEEQVQSTRALGRGRLSAKKKGR